MKPWKIVYDTYSAGVEKISAAIQPYLPYTLVCDKNFERNYNTVSVSLKPEINGYEITVYSADGENQRIDICAENKINLLYAASDFKNICLPYITTKTGDRVVDFYEYKPFCEPLRPYHLATYPKIRHRGLWTWGHTVYDYKKYIDNMVTLKMNTLIVWNDFVPTNIRDVIKYAHQNGVEIYLGFAWGWGINCAENDIRDTGYLTEKVVNQYKTEYADIPCDGIYFQSFTELSQTEINGISIADAVIAFVNRTAKELFSFNPDLKLLFGIHGTSVKHRADAFLAVDKRITLVWEDLGAFPFNNSSDYLENYDETECLTDKLQKLPQPFGAVLKGGYRLDWSTFKHRNGRFVMGVSEEKTLKEKLEKIKPLHRRLQADFIKNAPYAHRMIKSFGEDSLITVLAEDGLFEEAITYPVALYAQMLWDSQRPIEEIMHQTALMPDVTFI